MRDTEPHLADDDASAATVLLTAGEIVVLASLMREHRETTLSRYTFSATSQFLRRFAGEERSPSLVPADGFSK